MTISAQIISTDPPPPCLPHSVVESESTRSFRFSRGAALRRRETFAEPALLNSGRLSAMQRSGSFHQGSILSAARQWCGSVDELSNFSPRGLERAGGREERGERKQAPRRSRSRDELAQLESLGSGVEDSGRFHRAAQLRMRRWLDERRSAEMAPPEPQRAPPARPQRRRREPEPEQTSTSGWGSGSSGSGSGFSDSPDPEEPGRGGRGEYRLPEPRGFVSRGHRNAGRYSARHSEIPSPDYSSGTLSSATRINMSSSVLNLPSALY